MISSGMAEILRLLHGQAKPRIADGCAGILGMDHLAVSLAIEDQITEQLWSSGATSESFEDLQFTLGEGPGPDALRTGLLALEHDLSAAWADRWPALLPAMAHLPIQAVFCFPLCLGGIKVGILTALRSTSGPMAGQEVDDALALAAALTLQFLGAGSQLASWVDSQPDGELHRAVVHQATGMLSVQLGVPLGQALVRLRAYAYGHERSIIEAAEDIVSRRLRLDDDRPEPQSSGEARG
ncbi:ANTAR domain-containing protein [Streptomyces hypolithicus]